tara:strand:- start:3021 stop:3395 length:375 start_codon:yes stop_codon:yes gene_type:complete
MTYLDIARKESSNDQKDDSIINNLPYGWVYFKFDENKKIIRYNNYSEEDELEQEYYRDYPIRRNLYYKDLNRLIRYRIEDQERNYDTIYYNDIIEEYGEFNLDCDRDDNSSNEGNLSENDYYSD